MGVGVCALVRVNAYVRLHVCVRIYICIRVRAGACFWIFIFDGDDDSCALKASHNAVNLAARLMLFTWRFFSRIDSLHAKLEA